MAAAAFAGQASSFLRSSVTSVRIVSSDESLWKKGSYNIPPKPSHALVFCRTPSHITQEDKQGEERRFLNYGLSNFRRSANAAASLTV